LIDLEEKRFLRKNIGLYLGREENRVFFREFSDIKPACYVFDLDTQEFGTLLKPGKWAFPNLPSPSGTMSILQSHCLEFTEDRCLEQDKLWLLHPDGTIEMLARNMLAPGEGAWSCSPPALWLDDHSILTQTDNGKLVRVKLDKSTEPIVNIPIPRPIWKAPRLYRDNAGDIIYECGPVAVIVDVEKKKCSPYVWRTLGHGFDASHKGDKGWYTVRHEAKEIGRELIILYTAKTTEGHLAARLCDDIFGGGVLRVWSASTGGWKTHFCSVRSIIGWIEK
jgi:hypothetical protein